jgi:hypothetical protein
MQSGAGLLLPGRLSMLIQAPWSRSVPVTPFHLEIRAATASRSVPPMVMASESQRAKA